MRCAWLLLSKGKTIYLSKLLRELGVWDLHKVALLINANKNVCPWGLFCSLNPYFVAPFHREIILLPSI